MRQVVQPTGSNFKILKDEKPIYKYPTGAHN